LRAHRTTQLVAPRPPALDDPGRGRMSAPPERRQA
jgi:hypothetical protein